MIINTALCVRNKKFEFFKCLFFHHSFKCIRLRHKRSGDVGRFSVPSAFPLSRTRHSYSSPLSRYCHERFSSDWSEKRRAGKQSTEGSRFAYVNVSDAIRVLFNSPSAHHFINVLAYTTLGLADVL